MAAVLFVVPDPIGQVLVRATVTVFLVCPGGYPAMSLEEARRTYMEAKLLLGKGDRPTQGKTAAVSARQVMQVRPAVP